MRRLKAGGLGTLFGAWTRLMHSAMVAPVIDANWLGAQAYEGEARSQSVFHSSSAVQGEWRTWASGSTQYAPLAHGIVGA